MAVFSLLVACLGEGRRLEFYHFSTTLSLSLSLSICPLSLIHTHTVLFLSLALSLSLKGEREGGAVSELFLGQVPIPNKRHKKAMSERCLDRKKEICCTMKRKKFVVTVCARGCVRSAE